MERIVLVTGGFDPLHSGHIAYFKEARKLGDKLIVGLNSDEWLTRKKGRPFMPFHERCNIIEELACVDQVIGFNDEDDTACNAIFQMLSTKTRSDTVYKQKKNFFPSLTFFHLSAECCFICKILTVNILLLQH